MAKFMIGKTKPLEIPQFEQGVLRRPELDLRRCEKPTCVPDDLNTVKLLNNILQTVQKRYRYVPDRGRDTWFNWRTSERKPLVGPVREFDEGDCEEHMGLCAIEGNCQGVPYSTMMYILLEFPGVDHAVLGVQGIEHTYILDNRYDSVLRWGEWPLENMEPIAFLRASTDTWSDMRPQSTLADLIARPRYTLADLLARHNTTE